YREFPRQAPSDWDNSVDRRDFLKLMAASLAFAGLSGCGRTPEQYLVPYVKQPDGLTLGKPQFYATAMPFGADAIGLLVESHEGRPTKIEGNPDHPSSLGATNVFAQASVLNLYDPDRAQTVTKFGEIQTWSLFVESAQALAAELGLGGSVTLPAGAEKWLDTVAKDLQKHKGVSLVAAGEQQPAEVHALAHAINAALGNVGTTLYYTEPVEAHPVNHLE